MNHLKSKLSLPHTRDLISRGRVTPLASDIGSKRVTLVAASPGYGKTTFVAQAIEMLRAPCIWYRLDESDDGLDVFLSYLAFGVQQYCPEFSLEWSGAGGGNGLGFAQIRDVSARFLAEMERVVPDKLYLVLDDYHVVRNNLEINYFIQLLLDRFTPFLNVIIITRSIPSLKISKLLADRQINCVSGPELAFTPEEIQLFCKELYSIGLTDMQAGLLHEKTTGWVSGLVLFLGSLKLCRPAQLDDSIAGFSGSQRSVYSYLEENVYQQLPTEYRLFSLKTAILERISAPFCDTLLEMKNSASILYDLEDGQHFTLATDENRQSFYYHPLYREFLLAKLGREFSSEEIVHLYSRAALLFENSDNDQEALKHHIMAGNVEDASRLLTHLARPLIKQGRPQMVKSLLSSLPDQHMVDDPWFQFLQAGYYGLCNQLQLAAKGYEKVLKLFRKNEDEEGECVCRMELAEYYMSKGDFKRSEQEYKRILSANNTETYLTIIVIGYLIRVLTLLRKTREADNYANQATALLRELDDEVSLHTSRGWIAMAQGFRYAYTGDYHKALELGEKSRNLFGLANQYRFMSSSYFLISYSCFYLGLFEKGMSAAIEGLEIDYEKGIFDEFSEFLRLLRVRNWLEMDSSITENLSVAIDDCSKSLESFRLNNFPVGVAQANLVLHKAYLRGGDINRAEQCLRKGIEAIQEHDMGLIENELRVALSQLLFFDKPKEHRKEAMVLLKNAEEQLLSSSWHMCWVSRIYARYYWEYGHRETTYKYIIYSLKISEEEGFDAWILSEHHWIIPLLVDLFALDSMSGYIRKLILGLGSCAERPLLALKKKNNPNIKYGAGQLLDLLPCRPVPPITASLFGQFRLNVGDRAVPESSWTSKKARTLVKFLLFKHHKGYVDKDILMELLWPSEEPQRSVQRFHVALAALRKTLEPDIEKGMKSSYIRRSGTTYRIEIGAEGSIDTEEFRLSMERARNARDQDQEIGSYKDAEQLYRGDFLEEDPYEDWCREERDALKEEYLGALGKIIQYHEGQQQYSECIAYSNKYLRVDRYSEHITRSLMRYYASSGDMPMVIKTYEQFNSTLKKELECNASEETHELYSLLVTN